MDISPSALPKSVIESPQIGDAFWTWAVLTWLYVKKEISPKRGASLIGLLGSADFQIWLSQHHQLSWYDAAPKKATHAKSQTFEGLLARLAFEDATRAQEVVFNLLDQAFSGIDIDALIKSFDLVACEKRWQYNKNAHRVTASTQHFKGSGKSEGAARFNAVFTHYFPS